MIHSIDDENDGVALWKGRTSRKKTPTTTRARRGRRAAKRRLRNSSYLNLSLNRAKRTPPLPPLPCRAHLPLSPVAPLHSARPVRPVRRCPLTGLRTKRIRGGTRRRSHEAWLRAVHVLVWRVVVCRAGVCVVRRGRLLWRRRCRRRPEGDLWGLLLLLLLLLLGVLVPLL